MLVHLVDVSDSSGRPDVTKDVDVILGELSSFGAHLEEKPMIMVASKIDVVNKDKLAALKRYCKKHKLKLYEISAVTGKGIEASEVRDCGGSSGIPREGTQPSGRENLIRDIPARRIARISDLA